MDPFPLVGIIDIGGILKTIIPIFENFTHPVLPTELFDYLYETAENLNF